MFAGNNFARAGTIQVLVNTQVLMHRADTLFVHRDMRPYTFTEVHFYQG